METLALGIDGMTCGGCAASIEKLLYRVAGVEAATVSFAAGEAEIKFDPSRTGGEALAQAVTDAGYAVRAATLKQ
jgi:copper chaperone